MLEDYNYIYLSGEINNSTIDPIIETILEKNLEDEKPEYLKLIINSDGGEIHPAMSFVDVIQGSSIPIRGFGVGEVCSSALIILMACEKNYRYVTKNTRLMSHCASFCGLEGTIKNHISYMKYVKDLSDTIVDHYISCTGMTRELIESELLNGFDVNLTPLEALRYNIIDGISTLN